MCSYCSKPMSGARGLLPLHWNFTGFQVPRIMCTSKSTLTILLGRKRVCVCQVPHRQTHGIKSNWPLLLLITNWTKLSNLTPGLEAVPAPLRATPPHDLPQNQPKRARLPCISLHQRAWHSPELRNAAPQTRKTFSALPCSRLLYKIQEKLCSFRLSQGYELKNDLPYEQYNHILCCSTQTTSQNALCIKIHGSNLRCKLEARVV